MRVLLAGGGTAGHTSPLLATADALRRLDPDVEITCLGTPRGPREPRGARGRLPARADPAGAAAAPAQRRPAARSRPGCAARSRRRCAVLDRVRPDVVVGYGGYVSMPAYLAARRRKLPLVVHEQNALPGLANKAGARIARRVAVSFPDTAAAEGRVRRPADPPDDLRRSTGPRCAPRPGAFFGLDPDRPTLLVTGGSQGAAPAQPGGLRRRPRRWPTPGCRCCTSSARKGEADPVPDRRALRRGRRSSTGWTSRYAAADLVRLPRRRQQRHRGRRGRAARRSSCRCRSATASRRSTPARSSTPGARCWSTTPRSPPSGSPRTCPALATDPDRLAAHGRGGVRADPARRRREAGPDRPRAPGGRR